MSRLAAFIALLAGCNAPRLKDKVEVPSGLQRGTPMAYNDLGATADDEGIRAMISLPLRDPEGLDATLTALYDPASPSFRAYLTRDEFMARHAPPPSDIDEVSAWLSREGLKVARVATNRLMIEVTGTVGEFNLTFETELHHYSKADDDGFKTFGHLIDLIGDRAIVEKLDAVVVADPPADRDQLPMESGEIVIDPPDDTRLNLATIARTYGLDPLTQQGFEGQGVTLGVIIGATFKFKDLQSFWQSQGVTRADPVVIQTQEAPATRFTEATLDVEWAGGLAPKSDLLVYAGPDAHDTSLVYAFNEAIGEGKIDVLTDSFAHREDTTPRAIRRAYDAAARMGAALGITIVAASGDSGQPDVPGSSPFVTSVGGTVLVIEGGTRKEERAWVLSGSGDSLSFPAPSWQLPYVQADKRAVSDVALAGGSRYWVYVFGQWQAFAGTSFASPAMAGLIAVINSQRLAQGKPVVGFLNSTLYTNEAVQASFFDIAQGATSEHQAGVGWDYPSGWGAPNAAALAAALP
jgi:kumamolisin